MPLDLGVRIRQARLYAEMSQADLAKKLKVHRSAVAKWESNKGLNPKTKHVEAIARITGVSLEWLVTSRGQMTVDPNDPVLGMSMKTAARDSMEVSLLEWFRATPARARMSFIEYLRSMHPKPKTKKRAK
jgi:transcriptional regulator with XRE-family HTH domain